MRVGTSSYCCWIATIRVVATLSVAITVHVDLVVDYYGRITVRTRIVVVLMRIRLVDAACWLALIREGSAGVQQALVALIVVEIVEYSLLLLVLLVDGINGGQ